MAGALVPRGVTALSLLARHLTGSDVASGGECASVTGIHTNIHMLSLALHTTTHPRAHSHTHTRARNNTRAHVRSFIQSHMRDSFSLCCSTLTHRHSHAHTHAQHTRTHSHKNVRTACSLTVIVMNEETDLLYTTLVRFNGSTTLQVILYRVLRGIGNNNRKQRETSPDSKPRKFQ